MHRVSIIGSCVTRDPMKYLLDDLSIEWYQARTCITSMMSKPLKLDIDFENAQSPNFEKRSVQSDLTKIWREKLNQPVDAVILDFVDERFGLGGTEGHYFTYSTAYRAIAGDQAIALAGRFISPTSEEYAALLVKNLPAFCESIADINSLIINDSTWRYLMEDGTSFPEKMVETSKAENRILDLIFEALAKRTKATFLGIASHPIVAKVGHRWGDAPYHYSDDSEKFIADRLLAAVKQMAQPAVEAAAKP